MISLAEIAKALSCKFQGNGNLVFSSPSEPKTAKENQLALAIDPKYMEQLFDTKAKAAIIGMSKSLAIESARSIYLADQYKFSAVLLNIN